MSVCPSLSYQHLQSSRICTQWIAEAAAGHDEAVHRKQPTPSHQPGAQPWTAELQIHHAGRHQGGKTCSHRHSCRAVRSFLLPSFPNLVTVSSLLHSFSGWCFLTIFSSLHDETLICFNADVCCILIGCSCCVVQFSRIISLRDETREVKLTETSHRLNWYNISNSGQNLKDDNSLSSNLTPEDISHTHHNITFILSTVYSQTQISQTDNGGSLRGGAAGDEDPPSYLTTE